MSDMIRQVGEIDGLAERLHGNTKAADAFTFASLREHVDEVQDLLQKGDPHWKAETVDILIHGYMLLARHGVTAEETGCLMPVRIGRFREKITAAIQEGQG